jgi:hypothetical protein
LAIILIVSFAPMWSYRLLAAQRVDLWIVWMLGGVGLLYAPMAVLAVVLLGYVGALSPHIVIPSIFRAGWLYLVAVLLLIVIYGLEAILAYSLASHFSFPSPRSGVCKYVLSDGEWSGIGVDFSEAERRAKLDLMKVTGPACHGLGSSLDRWHHEYFKLDGLGQWSGSGGDDRSVVGDAECDRPRRADGSHAGGLCSSGDDFLATGPGSGSCGDGLHQYG